MVGLIAYGPTPPDQAVLWVLLATAGAYAAIGFTLALRLYRRRS